MLQSWLVHAVAAVAFVALVHAAAKAVEASRGWRDGNGDSSGGRSRDGAQSGDGASGTRTGAPVLARLAWLAALGSAGVSFLQVAFLHAAVLTADPTRPAVAAAWFHAVNLADTVKLILLGLVVASLTLALSAPARRWFAGFGVAVAVLLPVAGLAFANPAPALNAALTLSLLLLLLLTWAVAAAVRAGRLTGDRVSGHTGPATAG